MVGPLVIQRDVLLPRNLVYTGITRGKNLVVVVGQRKALAIAVRNNKTEQRFSGLLAKLKETRSSSLPAYVAGVVRLRSHLTALTPVGTCRRRAGKPFLQANLRDSPELDAVLLTASTAPGSYRHRDLLTPTLPLAPPTH